MDEFAPSLRPTDGDWCRAAVIASPFPLGTAVIDKPIAMHLRWDECCSSGPIFFLCCATDGDLA